MRNSLAQHTKHASSAAISICVVVPMYNAGHMIDECLVPILNMHEAGLVQHIIVVDDGSTDDGIERVSVHHQIELLHTGTQSGPAFARNLGAEATDCDYLWFVDADVILAEDAGRIVSRELRATEQADRKRLPAAIIGAYDTTPRAQNFLSQYKNLVHHFYHSRANTEAETFWSGCGLVERATFLEVQGFDVEKFPFPSVEDIDLGYRLRARGHTIRLVKDLNGKHLKEWRLVGLLHTEIFRRAIPWTRLMLERDSLTNDLNVSTQERARALLVACWGLCFLLCLFGVLGWGWLVVLSVVLVAANFPMLRFFANTKGPLFALAGGLFHQLYYAYSTIAFMAVWLELNVSRRGSLERYHGHARRSHPH